jgi:hypothetical protein
MLGCGMRGWGWGGDSGTGSSSLPYLGERKGTNCFSLTSQSGDNSEFKKATGKQRLKDKIDVASRS